MKWIPVLLWCGLIFLLSSQSHLPGPENLTAEFIFKKTGHLIAYGILFALTYRAFGKKSKKRVFKSFLFGIAYAITDEIHQRFVPGRTSMARDVVIDGIGMLCAWYMLKRFQKTT